MRRPISAPKFRAIYVLLLALIARVWTWAVIALADRPTLLGTAIPRLCARPAARGRCRSHRLHRQCRAQADAGRQTAGLGRLVLLARPFARHRACRRRDRRGGIRAGRPLSEFKAVGSIIGTGASAFFLLAIAVINLVILRGVWQSFRRARRGEPVAEQELDLLLSGRGLLARLFRPLFRMVSRSWQMLPVGFLFGLGFDTATEISLFTVAASQASGGMTFSTVMIFPALFMAGMTLVDTTDSVLDGRRLWLGLPQSDPQDLVQSHHHRHFGHRRASDRRRRGAGPHRRQTRPRRLLLESGRRSQSTVSPISAIWSSASSSPAGPSLI